MHKVAVVVGSSRTGSINLKFAQALSLLAKDRLAFTIIGLTDLPMYNDDLWPEPPAAVGAFKTEIEERDAVLFVTPEYNRSIPALLKNAIDWGSRPMGKSAWTGKPAAIVGTSPGAIGTAAAQQHLRAVVSVIGCHLMPQPEVYLTMKPDLIDDGLQITDTKTRTFLEGFLDKFARFVDRAQAGG